MILLDTNVVIGLMKRQNKLLRLNYRQALASGQPIVVSSIVLFELRYGIARSGREQQNRKHLEGFMDGPIAIVDFDAEDAIEAGSLRATLNAAGTPIGPYDVLIGAQALRRGATLVTAKAREFARIKGLTVEDWTAERE